MQTKRPVKNEGLKIAYKRLIVNALRYTRVLIFSPLLPDDKDHYKRYKKTQEAWFREDVQTDLDKVESKHFHLSLRTKLKI